MTQDEIIEMARQFCPYQSEEFRNAYYDGFMKASKLVAQYEREACFYLVKNYMKETENMEARGCLASVAYDIKARGQA